MRSGVNGRLGGGQSNSCGLPRYRDDEDGKPRCFFHYTGEDRDDDKLREKLEAAAKNDANLAHAHLKEADLRHADLSKVNLGGADLSGADLAYADLNGARLREANLGQANLWKADLSGAHLQGADLSGAFLMKADFSRTFMRFADLGRANLQGVNLKEANLAYANLSGAYLRAAAVSGAYLRRADLSEVNLWNATLTDACNLRGVDFTGARLKGCEISPDTKLEEVQWSEQYIIPGEGEVREGLDAEQRCASFRSCAAVYRQIKQSYQEYGQYQRAGVFFIRQKECQRFAMAAEGPPTAEGRSWLLWAWDVVSHYATRALWWLSYVTCHHGENPVRLLGVMLVLVILFAVAHSVCGIEDNSASPKSGHGYVVPPGLTLWKRRYWAERAVDALYFSAVIFTGLGSGDRRPATRAGKIVAISEVFLGIVSITIFVGFVIRKLIR